jgi:hypothetical protein
MAKQTPWGRLIKAGLVTRCFSLCIFARTIIAKTLYKIFQSLVKSALFLNKGSS